MLSMGKTGGLQLVVPIILHVPLSHECMIRLSHFEPGSSGFY